MKIAPAILGSSLLLAFAVDARAENEFIDRNTVVFDDIIGVGYVSGLGALGATSLSVGWVTLSSSKSKIANNESVTTTYGVAPSADFFVGHGFSVGGRFSLSRSSQRYGFTDQQTATQISTRRAFAPRVGYAFPISEHIVLWPRLELEIGSRSSVVESPAQPEVESNGSSFMIGGELGVVFPIQRHVAFSFGPRIAYFAASSDEEDGSSKQIDIGMRAAMRLAF